MLVNEIFYSIQGEGRYTGEPTVFIRLSGCNLKCPQCDTKYHTKQKSWTMLSITEEVRRLGGDSPKVCLTGGEPLLQPEWEHLVSLLKTFCNRISIETNGTIFPAGYPFNSKKVDFVVDCKCPSSAPILSFDRNWLFTSRETQLKFVVFNEGDLVFVEDFLTDYSYIEPEILISPGLSSPPSPTDKVWMREVAEFAKKRRIRYSLQIHKVIWGARKGV